MLSRIWQTAAAQLPVALQFELRRARFKRQIRRGQFRSPEPEALEVMRYIRSGDWAIDVGANVGHYTCAMARRVGTSGRVLAFEPIPVSFALLSANVRAANVGNVSLFNVALSSSTGIARMTVPHYERSHLENFYRAHLSTEGAVRVMCLPLDNIPIPGRVRLVKIDAEGHDLQVLMGMDALLRRDSPVVLVEAPSQGQVASWLRERGYAVRAVSGSANILATPFTWHEESTAAV